MTLSESFSDMCGAAKRFVSPNPQAQVVVLWGGVPSYCFSWLSPQQNPRPLILLALNATFLSIWMLSVGGFAVRTLPRH